MPGTCSGVYPIILADGRRTYARCEMETDGKQWTVIQRRFDGSVSFYRDWEDYKRGFGDVNGEFWLGNENIHRIVSGNTKSYKIRFDLVDYNNNTAYAEYSQFYVESEATDYKLTLAGYSGNAGHAMKDRSGRSINGMKFSTLDRDNDIGPFQCARDIKQAGFWFRDCVGGNVNGIYYNTSFSSSESMHWKLWRGKNCLKETQMIIIPIS